MNIGRKLKIRILLLFLITTIVFFLFGLWYIDKYGMGISESFEVNDPALETKLLLATQQSNYKDDLVDAFVSRIKQKSIYMKVIDVSNLDEIDDQAYDAIIIIHTWEIWEPPKSVTNFINEINNDLVYAIGTSGDGNLKLDNIDGMSSASLIVDIDKQVAGIMNWLHFNNIITKF